VSVREGPSAGKPAAQGAYLLERRRRVVRSWLPARRDHLLDYGCGNGAQTLLFKDDFTRITGVDITPSSLDDFAAAARRLGLEPSPELHRTDGRTIPVADADADCVMSFEVLEHVADEAAVLAEMRRVLRPDGTLILSVPNRWWIFETHGADLPLLPWNRVPLFSWLPKRLHDRWARARIYRRREITALLERSGFEALEARYLTAPMDMVGRAPLRDALRATLFRGDLTPVPLLATAVILRAGPRNPPFASPSRN